MLHWIMDARSTHGPVGDQGARPTCLSWAISAAHGHARGMGGLCVEYLHWATEHHPGGRGKVSAAAGALSIDGQPVETQWSYDAARDENSSSYFPPATVVGPQHTAGMRPCLATPAALEQELLAGRCPIVALRVTDSFMRAQGGVVLDDGRGAGGHAVVAVGIASYLGVSPIGDIAPGSRLLCVRNSWGTGWGVDGYALLSEAALAATSLGAFVVEPHAAGVP